MTALSRVRTALSGFPGGPGVSTMYFLDTATATASLEAFWTSLAVVLPSGLVIEVPDAGDVIEDTTGVITGSWASSPRAPLAGSSADEYAGPCGALLEWLTATIVDGRRLRGKTFLVPMTSGEFDTTGHVNAGTVAALVGFCATLVTAEAGNLVVWHRPYAGRAAGEDGPARAPHAGAHGIVTDSRVPPLAAVLRSRRD
jgi:hypothetical protein